MYKEMELTKNIRLRRLQCVGLVMGIKEKWVPKKPLKGYIEGRRPVGRPRRRWLDAVDRDVKRMLKCRNWKRLAETEMPGSRGLKMPRPRWDVMP
jgi:hypothetical protein